MKKLLAICLAAAAITTISGCANPMHSAWAYKPLHDAKSGAFETATGKLDYREFNTIDELAAAELDMHRDGYVMIGYVNMLSPQPKFVGRGGAKKWGNSIGASRALHAFGRGHFLATYWAKPKHLPLGAFYSDDVPEDAVAALGEVFEHDSAVIIDVVALDSPAYFAGMRPGDLLIEIDDAPITSSDDLSAILQVRSGQTSRFTVWSMFEGTPRFVDIELN
ncbi:MAG: PDZ domain-containing protein [Pseudomonadota bacterium]